MGKLPFCGSFWQESRLKMYAIILAMGEISPIWFVSKYFPAISREGGVDEAIDGGTQSIARRWSPGERVDFQVPEPSSSEAIYRELHAAIAQHHGAPINLVIQTGPDGIHSVLKFLQGLIKDFSGKIANVFLAMNTTFESMYDIGAKEIKPLNTRRLLALPLEAVEELLVKEEDRLTNLVKTSGFLRANQADQLGLFIFSAPKNREIVASGGTSTHVFLEGVKSVLEAASAPKSTAK